MVRLLTKLGSHASDNGCHMTYDEYQITFPGIAKSARKLQMISGLALMEKVSKMAVLVF